MRLEMRKPDMPMQSGFGVDLINDNGFRENIIVVPSENAANYALFQIRMVYEAGIEEGEKRAMAAGQNGRRSPELTAPHHMEGGKE